MISFKERYKLYIKLLERIEAEGTRKAISSFKDISSHHALVDIINYFEQIGLLYREPKGQKHLISLTNKGKQYLLAWKTMEDKVDLFK